MTLPLKSPTEAELAKEVVLELWERGPERDWKVPGLPGGICFRGVEFAVTKLVEEDTSILEVFLLDAIFYVPFIDELKWIEFVSDFKLLNFEFNKFRLVWLKAKSNKSDETK